MLGAQLSPKQPKWAVSEGSAFTLLEPQLVWLVCSFWNVVCKRQGWDCCLLNTCQSRWRLWASSPPPHSHTCSWAATVWPSVKAIISAAGETSRLLSLTCVPESRHEKPKKWFSRRRAYKSLKWHSMGLGFVWQARMGIVTSVFQNTYSPLHIHFLWKASKFNL